MLTAITAQTFRVQIPADTAREALSYAREMLPVTASKRLTLTAKRINNGTFEVWV